MTEAITPRTLERLASRSGMSLELNANGSLRQIACGGAVLCLFPGNEIEGGVANVFLRRHGETPAWTPLLGPASPTRFRPAAVEGRLVGSGTWNGIQYTLSLSLSQEAYAWFIHVHLSNGGSTQQRLDLTYAQDIALASYGAVRLNEFYVSQYVDHTPLVHPVRGLMVASRQNQAVDGRYPWSLIGSLREGVSFATDAIQFHGLAVREGRAPAGMVSELPGRRLQHEHSMAVVRDSLIVLDAHSDAHAGFFGVHVPDHREATSSADLERVSEILAVPEAVHSPAGAAPVEGPPGCSTLFTGSRLLASLDLDAEAVLEIFGMELRHEERDEDGSLLSFFHGADHHVALRRKELKVRRPHGHILRSGGHLTPDESALTSTAWMTGVFHSMVTQGHVGINRLLSTVRSYLSLYRSHGQRVFVELEGVWHLLDMPSAFEMSPHACRWIYRHAAGEIQVRAGAEESPHELTLDIEVTAGVPSRFLITHHVALNGDDGSTGGPARWVLEGERIRLTPAPGTELAQRFPRGAFFIAPRPGTRLEHVGGDEWIFLDRHTREQPFLCVVTTKTRSAGLGIRGELVPEESQPPLRVARESLGAKFSLRSAKGSGVADGIARLTEIVPWYAHDALVHYLSPRGLEQFSGGGWGTRDICQGPVELLLALGRTAPMRDLLLRVLRQQNPDGDWPQWFMFFDRERNIRPGDSHGDIVFWPLLALARYLTATQDAAVLDERVRFFDGRSTEDGELATVWQHAERALGLIRKRLIPGTSLAAYGHGDWNDSLQPVDSRLRERLCSAWTVTLHYQVLLALGNALASLGRQADAEALRREARAVHADFQRLLVVDGVLAGYALFEDEGRVRYLLHPRDETTGVHFSALAMIHAVLEDLFSPVQARDHLRLIEEKLSAPDGVRLFDRPMPYHGGPQKLFQRAESASFFGREIGLMYTHAHLRYAQALAHVGAADAFFCALCQANPIGIQSIVPSATLRQSNCYYSSSDAAFPDRYQASERYSGVIDGTVPLDGGWRVYSSGPGIALGLIVRRFLGLDLEADVLSLDPVLPATLKTLTVSTLLLDRDIEVRYRIDDPGRGVTAATLNGVALELAFRRNPHRCGAAIVSRSAFVQLLRAEGNVLQIEVGTPALGSR